LRDELHRYLGGILSHLDCPPLLIGGVEDHVHLLCLLSRVCAPAKLVREVKRSSTLWLKTKGPGLRDFAWQNGYAMFSLGYSQIDSVRDYISRQEEHHRKVSFQDELRQFLKRYQVAYDERHVWD
jgi:REP element-mobilizing transposase RayT